MFNFSSRGDMEVETDVSPMNIFRCIQYTQISDNSYMYYVLASEYILYADALKRKEKNSDTAVGQTLIYTCQNF